MATISTNNYTLGSGSLYFCATVAEARLVGTHLRTSAYSMGNITDTELSVDVTYIDHWVSVKGKRLKDKTVANTTSVMINFSFDEMNLTNLKRFFLGTDGGGSKLNVVQDVTSEGCAVLVVDTDIGRDMVYYIPKCTLKPDGALGLNEEDWHSAPMVLEVLQYTAGETDQASWNATWLVKPFGYMDATALA